MFQRLLNLPELLNKKSHFLFGPRSVGKTTLIENQLSDAKLYDLLDDETYDRLLRRPKVLEEELPGGKQLIVIDEIQRLPKLLNEVHRLIKAKEATFLLTGSSARKLRRGGANLLGGRAWEAHLHPLCFKELPQFNLNRYLNHGGLPHVWQSHSPIDELKNYARLYIREEIIAEALVRKAENFVRFLDVFAINNGEELNYEGLSSDTGVSAKTVANYVEILDDTLMGFQVQPFLKSRKRKAITRSKFYLFDLGVVNILARRGEIFDGSELFGKAFEHFIARELRTYLDYAGVDSPLCYWRTTSQIEVDFIVGNELAIEVKSNTLVQPGHLKGLKALRDEGLIRNYAVVSLDAEPRVMDGIQIWPWRFFLEKLWDGKLI